MREDAVVFAQVTGGYSMIRMLVLAAVAAFSFAAPAAAQTVTYNSNPNTPFTYGSGNDYTPANAAVLTNGSLELASRFHVNGLPADPSSGTGVYSFALGTTNINFDYSAINYGGPFSTFTVLLTNMLTGDTATYINTLIPDANGMARGYQGSQQLRFGFLNGSVPSIGDLNFDANVNNTYRFDLIGGDNRLTTFAQIGTGVGAVPEPGTWAMMIVGFGVAGAAMRRRRKQAAVQFA